MTIDQLKVIRAHIQATLKLTPDSNEAFTLKHMLTRSLEQCNKLIGELS